MISLGDGSINSDDDGETEEAAEPGGLASIGRTRRALIRACDLQSKYLSTWICAKIYLVFRIHTMCEIVCTGKCMEGIIG